MKREKGVCSVENGSTIVEDWTILFGNKTNSKDLQKCRNKWSKNILWRWNFTETAEWRGKGIASGGIMPKQQEGEYKYFVSFGDPHQCSLASQPQGKHHPPVPQSAPHVPQLTLPSMTTEAAQELLPTWKAPFQGTGGGCGVVAGRALRCDLFQSCAWHVPVPPWQSFQSRFTARVTAITTQCCLALKVSSHSSKVRESQKFFLIYNELPVYLQEQTFL